jgi:predicted NBD/HSP70 family sugar kinase
MPPAAVDIGGTKIQVVDARRETAPVTELATPVRDGPDAIIDCIAGALASLPGPGPVVVASPGSLDVAGGIVHYAANLPFAEFPLAARLKAATRRPVRLVGDGVAAAVGEFSTGAGAGHRDGIYITVSTGIGMGLVVNGRLVTGAADQAGELGHVPVVTGPAALPCSCGQTGCLEAYASGRALAARAAGRIAAAPDAAAAPGTTAAGPGATAPLPLTAREVLDAARRGDPAAGAPLDEAVELLATAVASLVRLLAPPVVVLGGGLMLAGGLLGPVRDRVAGILAVTVPGIADAMVPARHGRFSGLRGAALIARADPRAIGLLDGRSRRQEP